MRIISVLILPLLLFGFIELYLWSSLSQSFGSVHVITISSIAISVLGYIGIFLGIRYWNKRPLMRMGITNFFIGMGFAVIVQKFVFLSLTIISSLISWILELSGLQVDSFFSTALGLGFLISGVILLSMTYGVIWGKYRFQLEEVILGFPDLPKAFDGFTILQLSDAHSGTWDDLKGVEKGIELARKQEADMIVFTGDLVNGHKDEIDPFIDLFSQLRAPHGKFAILGNHDYYGQPREQSERGAYYDDFFSKYESMGFQLLLNESRAIQKDNDTMNLIGVENWGSGRYFPKKANLDQATLECKNGGFSILLSHDPSHWEHKALDYPKHFHLTLSGHTHGMQFGINLPFLKWSPVKYRYKKWLGLYKEQDQYLYVNRGFGVLAYPGRVGMSPEVTKITLRREAD